MRKWILAVVLALPVYGNLAADDSATTDPDKANACVKPDPGSYEGSCDARVGLPVEQSPHPLHKWITCLQEKRGWGSGGYGDAIFFKDLVPVWEQEMAEYLRILSGLMGKKDKKELEKEQMAWEEARATALKRRWERPRPEGTMHMALAAVDELEFPERRALELGCRIEKLKPKNQRPQQNAK